MASYEKAAGNLDEWAFTDDSRRAGRNSGHCNLREEVGVGPQSLAFRVLAMGGASH